MNGDEVVSIFLLLLLLGLPFTALWIYALVDCARNEPAAGLTRMNWLLVIAIGGAFGAALYLLYRRPRRPKRDAVLDDPEGRSIFVRRPNDWKS